VQYVEFESKGLKPGYHLIGSRVETRRLGLKPSYGSGGVIVHRPTEVVEYDVVLLGHDGGEVERRLGEHQGVAAQVDAFESKGLKCMPDLSGLYLA
jgi:hypothetical protein